MIDTNLGYFSCWKDYITYCNAIGVIPNEKYNEEVEEKIDEILIKYYENRGNKK